MEGEIEAGRLRPEEEGEGKKKKRKKNLVDESLRGEECGLVRLPACRGTFPYALLPGCDFGGNI